ncbi:sensor histidine kinase [Sporolactobacillus terrae]|uniref:histidine kinase n=1 Tax=Sporolactobacillus terrae TaxID=269673 RepID=A0A5K7WYC7_9BACL|nr:HAMP domain-containing sensor histidine kinase [Sporolactobacillus terrae]BBN97618.1 hypothetical protein St703_03230 [Sporolactobacillus terrae]
MTFNRIGLKLGTAIMALMIVILICLGLAVDRLFTNFYDTQMREDTRDIADHLIKMIDTRKSASISMIRTFAEFSNVSIYWMNADGRILAVEGKKYRSVPLFIRGSENRSLLTGEEDVFRYQDQQGNRFYVAGKSIGSGNTPQSTIYVVSSMKKMDTSLAHLRGLLLLSGIGAFLLAIGLIWMMSNVLSRPLLQMQKMTKKMAEGNLGTRLTVKSRDEIGALGRAINDLAARLQRYRDSRQAFFSTISHELRTPVTYLKGYAKALNDGLVDSDNERKQYLSIIYQESIRLEHLIRDLFDLSKMEEGQIKLDIELLDLKELMETALQKVKLKAEEKKIRVQAELTDGVPLVSGDRKRTEQILLNLLENAIRYSERGMVVARLASDKQNVVIAISDNGIGIPKEELPYIFERFYRVEKSRAREYGGTGLGLSIVKKYIELQGGTVKVESQLGAGTTFTLLFPRGKGQGKDERSYEKK